MTVQFNSIADFILMGEHGVYIWSAYGISLMAIIALQYMVRTRNRQLRRILAQLKDSR